MKLTADDLLELARKADPSARIDRTAWGQALLVTTAFGIDNVLVFNPKPMRTEMPEEAKAS